MTPVTLPTHYRQIKLLALRLRRSCGNIPGALSSSVLGEGGVHGEVAYVVSTRMQGSSLDMSVRLQQPEANLQERRPKFK